MRINYPSLFLCPVADLERVFRYVFLLIGLKPRYYPNHEAGAIIRTILNESYGDLTIGELALAFQLAITRRTEVDPNPYNNFSAAYVMGILDAYKKWETFIMKSVNKTRSDNFYRRILQECYDEYLKHKREPALIEVSALYEQLIYDGFIQAPGSAGVIDKERTIHNFFAHAKKKGFPRLYINEK